MCLFDSNDSVLLFSENKYDDDDRRGTVDYSSYHDTCLYVRRAVMPMTINRQCPERGQCTFRPFSPMAHTLVLKQPKAFLPISDSPAV